MRYFQQIAAGIDVLPVVVELHRQPELWNANKERTAGGEGPHGAVDDIWVRFRDAAELTRPESFNEPFIPVMYPAWHALPSLRPIVFSLMARLQAVQLGGILITRVPAGQQVAPHDDRGRWHPEFFNTKVFIPLKSNTRCYNTCGDEAVVMQVGDAWSFDNRVIHSTVNDGPDDRMTLIVSLRCE